MFVVFGPVRGADAAVDDVIFGLDLGAGVAVDPVCGSGPVLVGAVRAVSLQGWRRVVSVRAGVLVIGRLVLGASERAGVLVCSGLGLATSSLTVPSEGAEGVPAAASCWSSTVAAWSASTPGCFPASVCCGERACSAGCGGVRVGRLGCGQWGWASAP